MMLGTEPPGRYSRVDKLIERLFLKPDRKGFYRTFGLSGHHSEDRATICAAAQKRAQPREGVIPATSGYRFLHDRFQLSAKTIFIRLVPDVVVHVPVLGYARVTMRDEQHAPRDEPIHSGQNIPGGEIAAVIQNIRYGAWIYLPADLT